MCILSTFCIPSSSPSFSSCSSSLLIFPLIYRIFVFFFLFILHFYFASRTLNVSSSFFFLSPGQSFFYLLFFSLSLTTLFLFHPRPPRPVYALPLAACIIFSVSCISSFPTILPTSQHAQFSLLATKLPFLILSLPPYSPFVLCLLPLFFLPLLPPLLP